GDSLDPAKWLIAGEDGVALTVTDVAISGAGILLTTNEATTGATYALEVPSGIILATDSSPLVAPFVWDFTGVGQAPVAFLAQVIDARHVRVIFSEPVHDGALEAGNYSIDNDLQVLAVTKETDRNYVLTTTVQASDVLYTITITDVKDDAENPT